MTKKERAEIPATQTTEGQKIAPAVIPPTITAKSPKAPAAPKQFENAAKPVKPAAKRGKKKAAAKRAPAKKAPAKKAASKPAAPAPSDAAPDDDAPF